MRTGWALGAALVAAGALSSCGDTPIAKDTRVAIVSPAENADVAPPFRVSWTARNVEGVTFAVLFDRHPMAPGRPLASLVAKQDPCRALPQCPDERWLANNDVYVTREGHVDVRSLLDLGGRDERRRVTIVLLGRDGRRIGESAFIRNFRLERGA